MRNTIKNVLIVVLVFIIICQFWEYLKNGPEILHNITKERANIKAVVLPAKTDSALANFSNRFPSELSFLVYTLIC
jgi:hypothetical protein